MWGRRPTWIWMASPHRLPRGNEKKRKKPVGEGILLLCTDWWAGRMWTTLFCHTLPTMVAKTCETDSAQILLLVNCFSQDFGHNDKKLTNLSLKKNNCLLNQMKALCIIQTTFYKCGLFLNLFLPIHLSLSHSLTQWPIWSLLKGNHSRLRVVRCVFTKSWGQHLEMVLSLSRSSVWWQSLTFIPAEQGIACRMMSQEFETSMRH